MLERRAPPHESWPQRKDWKRPAKPATWPLPEESSRKRARQAMEAAVPEAVLAAEVACPVAAAVGFQKEAEVEVVTEAEEEHLGVP